MEIKGKKVLLIAPSYYSLEKEIKQALEFNGADVDYFEDIFFKYDWRYSNCVGIRKYIYPIIEKINKKRERYWRKQSSFFRNYDILLWVDGYSFSPYVIESIRKNNPNIITVLYLYDDTIFYNFESLFPFFDRLYSFDLRDVERYKGKWDLKYKPLYWVKHNKNEKAKYQFSSVGYCNLERLQAFNLLNETGLFLNKNVSFHLYLPVLSQIGYLKCRLKRLLFKSQRKDQELLLGKIQSPYITRVPVSYEENIKILCESSCVIDIVKKTQVGFSNRAMQTVGNGIKLISNNKSLLDAPFYDKDMIYILDFHNINKEEILNFINGDSRSSTNSYLNSQEINNWVLSF